MHASSCNLYPSIATEPAQAVRGDTFLTKLKEYVSSEKLASRSPMSPSGFRGPRTSPTVTSHSSFLFAGMAPKSATGEMSRAVNSSYANTCSGVMNQWKKSTGTRRGVPLSRTGSPSRLSIFLEDACE